MFERQIVRVRHGRLASHVQHEARAVDRVSVRVNLSSSKSQPMRQATGAAAFTSALAPAA